MIMTLHKLLAVPTLLKHVYIKVYKQGLHNMYCIYIPYMCTCNTLYSATS